LPGSDAADLKLLCDAARDAGDIAMRFWRRDPQVWDKGDDAGPVTEADLAVNEMLEDRLRKARPDYGWLSEETPDISDRQHRARTFIIDPIDGTRAFIAGENTFSHSLAIAEAGVVTAAAVYVPAIDKMYCASKATIATLNDVPIFASNQAGIAGGSVLTSKVNMLPEHWPGGVPDLRRSFRPSLAYRLCLVAEGRFDSMVTFRPTWEWDIAAGSLIASRAGVIVSDGQGAALVLNAPDPRTPGIIAASAGLHQAMLARRLA
jgi:myo-inositol-1(or 4)-monophosphatase